MPNGRGPTGQSMSPSWGEGGVKARARAHDLVPMGNPAIIQFLIWTPTKQSYLPCPIFKRNCHCIFEGRLSTNPVLWSALYLQGSKYNIDFHVPLVNKQLIGISFPKWNHQWNELSLKSTVPKTCKWMLIEHVMNLEVKNITKSSLTLRM